MPSNSDFEIDSGSSCFERLVKHQLTKNNFRSLFEQVNVRFPEVVDIFSDDGVVRSDLVKTMRYISLMTHHNIRSYAPNSHTIFFLCAHDYALKTVTSTHIEEAPYTEGAQEETEALEGNRNSTEGQEAPRDLDGSNCCHFYLHFCKDKENLWRLKEDEKNNIEMSCGLCFQPTLCMHAGFIADLIRNHIPCASLDYDYKSHLKLVSDILEREFSFKPNYFTLRIALNKVRENDRASVLKQNQQVESYLMELNKKGQCGVILYSNSDLVVPGPDGTTSLIKYLDIYNIPDKIHVPSRFENFWDSLPEREAGTEKKYIYMTFQAVAAAMRAFQYSIPVICLDACTISSYHTRGVLLSATFATTEFNLLTMCVGTAEKESVASWDFFLANLRHSLLKFCPELKWDKLVFMSDRHLGIISGVRKYFSGNHHLYCLVHLLRNVGCSNKVREYFWKAAEAKDEADFDDYFQELVNFTPKAKGLVDFKDRWSRFAISTKCVRYGVRTNNWAEIQNNAVKFLRYGSVLNVLMKFFIYTSSKLGDYQKKAESLKKMRATPQGSNFTNYATEVVLVRNIRSAKGDNIFSYNTAGNVWNVETIFGGKKRVYTVTLDGRNSTCTCGRYSDEGIPCPHIIHSFYKHQSPYPPNNRELMEVFIDPIYSASRFLDAFPSEKIFVPSPMDTYRINESVTLQEGVTRRGSPQKLRYPSVNEDMSKNPHVSLAFRKGFRGKCGSDAPCACNDGDVSQGSMKLYLGGDKQAHEWKEIQFMIAEERCYPEVIFPPLDQDSSSSAHQECDISDPASLIIDGNVQSIQATNSLEKSMPLIDAEKICSQDDAIILRSSRIIDGEYDVNNPITLEELEREETPNITDAVNTLIPNDGQSSLLGYEHNSSNSDANEDILISSTKGYEKESHSLCRIPPKQRVRVEDLEISHEIGSMMPSNMAGEGVSTEEKIGFLVIHSERYYSYCEKLYLIFQVDKMNSKWEEQNEYPSFEHPAVIPMLYPLPRDLILCDEDWLMKADVTWPRNKPVPVIATDMLVKFLAHVHCNTVVGYKSQAFGYTHPCCDTIKYLGIFPQKNTLEFVKGINCDIGDVPPFDSCGMDETSPGTEGVYKMCCWIITHPTSKPFLTNDEIIQLYHYTSQNKDCFCIIISPRSSGVKMLCVKLTDEGYDEIKRLEDHITCNAVSTMKVNPDLKYAMSHSSVKFYYHIPCKMSDDLCIYCDLRDTAQVLQQLMIPILAGDYSHIW